MKMEILKHIGEMETLSQVTAALWEQGYTIDFNLRSDQLPQGQNLLEESPFNFQIDRSYRFEGESDPEDEAIVYAISSIEGTLKGILVDGYGTSSQEDWQQIIAILKKA